MDSIIALMNRFSRIFFRLACLAIPALPAGTMAAPRTVVFDFELVDSSLGGELKGTQPEEKARLARMAPTLREKLEASGRYEIVPLGEVEAQAAAQNLQSCGGCDVLMAKKLGADLSVTGVMQKVSDQILNINVYIRDAKTGALVENYSADVRNNTDESWARGLSYLIRNRLLVDKEPAKPVPEKALPEKASPEKAPQ